MLFKDRLRALRIEKDVTQTELGKFLGVGATTVNGYEKGIISNPPLDKLTKLSDFFGVSIDYLAARSSVRKIPNNEARNLADRFQDMLDVLDSDTKCYYHGRLLTAKEKDLLKTLISGTVLTIEKILK